MHKWYLNSQFCALSFLFLLSHWCRLEKKLSWYGWTSWMWLLLLSIEKNWKLYWCCDIIVRFLTPSFFTKSCFFLQNSSTNCFPLNLCPIDPIFYLSLSFITYTHVSYVPHNVFRAYATLLYCYCQHDNEFAIKKFFYFCLKWNWGEKVMSVCGVEFIWKEIRA